MAKQKVTHRLSLLSTDGDGAIWLACECGKFDVCVGSRPDLDAISDRANQHLLDVDAD